MPLFVDKFFFLDTGSGLSAILMQDIIDKRLFTYLPSAYFRVKWVYYPPKSMAGYSEYIPSLSRVCLEYIPSPI